MKNIVKMQLSNGFGNNIFQYVAGKLLAHYHDCDLIIIPPWIEDFHSTAGPKEVPLA